MSCCIRESQRGGAAVELESRVSSPPQIVTRQPTGQPGPDIHGLNGILQSHHPSLSWSTDTPPVTTSRNHMRQTSTNLPDEGKLVIAIDFGTTFSGIAYGSSRIASGKVQQILKWPGSSETFRKIPTCLLYDEDSRVLAWGLEAKNANILGTTRYEWFKLFLDPRALRNETSLDPRLPALPLGKTPSDLITDFLSCLWEYTREQITRDIGAVADLDYADIWVTVPAAWDARGCAMMRQAAIDAGMVQSAYAGDVEWRERLKIISEPEAAAVHCALLTDLYKLQISQNFIVCDAGGGTVDLAVYKIIGDPSRLEIAEVAARSGASCGSLLLDLRFRSLVEALLINHPVHLDPPSLAYFMHSFSEADKLTYAGRPDDGSVFYFNCFNVEDTNDPDAGLLNGQLAISGRLLREAVFDPVVNEVIELISNQLSTSPRIDALLLVGGFAGSAYLKTRIEETFGHDISVISRPPDSDTATLRGAARYGLARRPLVSQLIVPRSYVMIVRLPAEPEDRERRPGYVSRNDAGVEICENRLQYLVQRGVIIRKGQRVTTRFCKFSRDTMDSTFTATLYTTEATAAEARYADEGALRELCVWRVDLKGVGAFRANASASAEEGFYTDFDIGLEVDSAEVRGVLLDTAGLEWGRVVFGFTT